MAIQGIGNLWHLAKTGFGSINKLSGNFNKDS
jgi:hypothetical protein